MPVKGGGIELGQEINAAEARIDAIGDGDIHQAVFAGQRHGRLAPFAGQREQARALPSAHDDGEHIARIDRHANILCHKRARLLGRQW